jgi:hypothetical protein
MAGQVNPSSAGPAGLSGVGVGGGLDLLTDGSVVIDNTNVTGNNSTTTDRDVAGTFSV